MPRNGDIFGIFITWYNICRHLPKSSVPSVIVSIVTIAVCYPCKLISLKVKSLKNKCLNSRTVGWSLWRQKAVKSISCETESLNRPHIFFSLNYVLTRGRHDSRFWWLPVTTGYQNFVSGWLPVTTGYQNFVSGWLPVTTGYQNFVLGWLPVTTGYQNFVSGLLPVTTG